MLPIRSLALGLLLLLAPGAGAAAPVLRVGMLAGSPPCSEQAAPGRWQGRAVDLWELIAYREQLAFLARPYPDARSLLEAARTDAVDVAVGCLTISPDRLGRYRFGLPFQEEGLALLARTDKLATGQSLIRALLNPELLRVLALYLLVIALLSLVVWLDEHRPTAGPGLRGRLRSYALVFQVLATGPGTNVIVSRSRGHALVILSWVVRLSGASLILSTITLDVIREPGAGGFQPRSLADLAGRRVAVRPGSISARLLEEPPLRGRVTAVPMPVVREAPELLLSGAADAVLADEQQLRYVRERASAGQRARLQLVLAGIHRQSQAFAFSPRLDAALVGRIDLAISEAKQDGLVR